MVIDRYLKCKICGTIVKLRVQMGYMHVIPFVYKCPKCGIIIRGRIYIDVAKNLFNIKKLVNCLDVTREKYHQSSAAYAVQLSSELYTQKIVNIINDGINIPTPFMLYNILGLFKCDKKTFHIFKKISLITGRDFLHKKDSFSALMELLEENPNSKYLRKLMIKYNLISNRVNSGRFRRISIINKSVKIFNYYFKDLWKFSELNKLMKECIYNTKLMKHKYHKQINVLKRIYKSNITYYIHLLYRLALNFYKYSSFILPSISNYSIGIRIGMQKDWPKLTYIKNKMGMFQSDFYILKSYYSSNYEMILDIMPIFILLQNIENRGSIYKFKSNFHKFGTDNQLFKALIKNKIPKYSISKAISGDNKMLFPRYMITETLNNKYRNSISHESWDYDYSSQLITFHDRGEKFHLYLIEFGEYIFQGWIISYEMLMMMKILFE